MKKIYSVKYVIVLLLFCALFKYSTAQVSQVVYSTIGTHTFTVPAGYTENITVYAWGAGGSGALSSILAAGGGGGGAYSQKSFTLEPGNYTVYVGAGGVWSGTPHSSSYFINTNTLEARGGSNGSERIGGAGGAASTGYISYAGGNGGTAVLENRSGGGGGGGAAGSNGNGGDGGDGTNVDGVGGISGAGGNAGVDYYHKSGAGGEGGSQYVFSTPIPGNDGLAVGGGGGGFSTDGSVSGLGANGLVIIDVEDIVTTLPVTFGEVNARIIDDLLKVNFTTFSETNNDHFEVQVSNDGSFFKTVKLVIPENDNSNIPQHYEATVSVSIITSLFGLPAILGLISLGVNRRKRILFFILSLIILLVNFIACSKQNENTVSKKAYNFFIRIKQVDKDGQCKYSKVVRGY